MGTRSLPVETFDLEETTLVAYPLDEQHLDEEEQQTVPEVPAGLLHIAFPEPNA